MAKYNKEYARESQKRYHQKNRELKKLYQSQNIYGETYTDFKKRMKRESRDLKVE